MTEVGGMLNERPSRNTKRVHFVGKHATEWLSKIGMLSKNGYMSAAI